MTGPPLIIKDLGRTHYEPVLETQRRIHYEKSLNRTAPDYILVTEHHHVLTLGRTADSRNLLAKEELERLGVPVVPTERGGDVTYHGPGQLVVYPILDLKRNGISVSKLVHVLEDIGIRFLALYGLKGVRSPVGRGVFVENRKIEFIGVAIKKYVSFHGLSLNVSPDLRYFSLIRPCGIEGLKVTSLGEELGAHAPGFSEAKEKLIGILREGFDTALHSV
ncbi:MAG: lipoyl(octanoyl) transferase LipB [Deltaproteobacteria bacterium]|nr:lipoyl(octanoyl) transferase LipB [Deltaproteobacteria bacterium]